MALTGLHVLSLESRRAKDIESLIIRQSGIPFVAPSVRERAVDDHSIAIRFVEELEAGAFEIVVCMTGVGLAFLRDVVTTQMPVERLSAALRRALIVSRGTKPIPILRALQVPIGILIPEPNTWKEIVAAITPRPERRIAVQEYGRPNLEMNAALEALGASVTPFALYRWELPEDIEPLREAARRLARNEVDVAVFTSSIQLDHLRDIARGLGIEAQMMDSLARRVVIASVGPVMTAALIAQGLPPDVIPNSPKMGALIVATSELAEAALKKKRGLGP
jgi:uroporphyrinogen-III synthase